MTRRIFIILLGLGLVSGCARHRSGAPRTRPPVETYRDGSRAGRVITFSGRDWVVKGSDAPVGPGPNGFSDKPDAVWVDREGRLHLTIREVDGRWLCTEVVSRDPVGYGTYMFHLRGALDGLDPNVVLGLFTWDDTSYDTQANCEIDIECSRWTEAGAPPLHYSVQPTTGPDEPGGRYPERYHAQAWAQQHPQTQHVFDWSPDRIEFASYEGEAPALVAGWTYRGDAPRRRAVQDGVVTAPLGIPAPGPNTHLRMNLWLVDGDRSGTGDPPTAAQPVEVVIDRFDYRPAQGP